MPPKIYNCACCGRKLKQDHWIYSAWTKARYCWPGEGCAKKKKKVKT